MSSEPITYFRYNDPKTKRDFYFNSQTKETVWVYPMDGIVLDPDTRERVESPRRRNTVRHRNHTVTTPTTDAAAELRSRDRPKKDVSSSRRRRASVSRTGLRSRHGRDAPSVMTAFKNRLAELSGKPFDIEAFANEHFRKPKTKSKGPIWEFSGDSISDSLLASLNKNASKEAVKFFKAMLKVVKDHKEKNEMVAIVESCRKEPELVDEVLCQCVKQTTEAPSEAMVPYLNVILTIVTLFLPSPFMHDFLFWHLAMVQSRSEVQRIKELAQFAFIRLIGSIDNEKPCFDYTKPEDIVAIKTHPALGSHVFGSCLNEIFWVQARTHPNCPVPFVMHEMAEAMIRLGAENTQGIFRLPGNLGKVNEMAARANRGERYLEGANAHDVASLFKKWVREIPGGILGCAKTSEMLACHDNNARIIAVADSLPPERRSILMYLVGFLRRMAKSDSVTLMGIPNLAMVFAPNISRIPDDTNPLNQASMTNNVIACLSALIVSWDVSAIYPLNENLAQ